MDTTLRPPLTVAVAQLNPIVGDLAGNADRIIAACAEARAAGADLLLTPELALSGYPPEDLLLRPDFYRACARELARIAAATEGLCVVVGHPGEVGASCWHNMATVIRERTVIAEYQKHLLPNYEVFDEERYFEPGDAACVFEHRGYRIGVTICADLWEPGPSAAAREAGAELLLALNASPYHMDKQRVRVQVLRDRVSEIRLPVLYCNMVGGQDELVFDGASFALDRDGRLAYQAASFEESLDLVRYQDNAWQSEIHARPRLPEADSRWMSLAPCLSASYRVELTSFTTGLASALMRRSDSSSTVSPLAPAARSSSSPPARRSSPSWRARQAARSSRRASAVVKGSARRAPRPSSRSSSKGSATASHSAPASSRNATHSRCSTVSNGSAPKSGASAIRRPASSRARPAPAARRARRASAAALIRWSPRAGRSAGTSAPR